jgi:transcriptional regulator with XRE-family HTH domain
VELNNIENLNEDFIKEFYKSIGKNVASLRKKHKISQLDLAHMLGHKSSSQVAGSEICYKNYHFNLEQLVKIAYIFNIDIKELFDGIDLDEINRIPLKED